MSSEFSPELRGELLDDFYAECDELLTSVRTGLSRLEEAREGEVPNPAVIEALFRGVHSVKGISAIVGLRPAEQLAHGMEDLLRALSKNLIPCTAEILDGLLLATDRMEQIVTGHRLAKSTPEITEVLEQLRQSLPSQSLAGSEVRPPTAPAPETKSDPAASARTRGLTLFRATFSPTAELDQRGVNVSAIRERLQRAGEILSATPSVLGKGLVVFEFTVGFTEAPTDFGLWANDGVRLEPIEAPAALSTPLPETTSSDPASATSISLTPSHIVRVDLARLDDLMRITGEMVIHRSRLEERIDRAGRDSTGLKEINLALAKFLREMRQAIARVRMVPIAEIFARIPFIVRDLARDSGKKADVVLDGQHTEVDKYLVERLKEPLLHLVRNAFTHGIENPAERSAVGKPPQATISLRATSEGGSVVIQVGDDGRGIDLAAVSARAASAGLKMDGADRLDHVGVLKILCTAGFSTRDQADLLAGRGVGMAVVANTIRELGGTLSLDTNLGRGTTFTLKLPLTLSIADAIIVTVGDQTCAVPQAAVDEIIQVPAQDVRLIQQTPVIPYRSGVLPIVLLRSLFQLPRASAETLTLLVVSAERGSIGLVVDQVRSHREIVVRPLADPLLRVPGISGATELGDGRPILILDPAAINDGVVRPTPDGNSSALSRPTQPAS